MWWQIQGHRLDTEDIRKGNFPKDLRAAEQVALGFGQRWLSGAATFYLTTSGSTGQPKSIVLQRNAMVASAQMTAAALQLKSGGTALLCLDPCYIAGTMMMVRSLTVEMNLVIIEPSANPIAQLKPETKIDFTALVPYQLQAILQSSSRDRLQDLGTIILGGAAVGEDLRKVIRSLPGKIYATYGMTETLSHIALQQLNGTEPQDHFVTLPGIHIAKDDRACLTIQVDYFGDEKIITNDLVEILSDHSFHWLGRIDNVINSGGVKVIPEKVEKTVYSVLEQMGWSNRFFVSSIPDVTLGNKVVLVLERENISIAENDLLRQALTGQLSRYELPKQIFVVAKFEETGSQKIDRQTTLRRLLI